MFRHVVMFRWKPGVRQAERDKALAQIRDLASLPGIVRLSAGEDAGIAQDNADTVVVVDFDRAEDYLRYAEHPQHQQVIAEHIRPILDSRVAVQYEL